MQLQSVPPAVGQQTFDVTYAQRDWRLSRHITVEPGTGLLRVELLESLVRFTQAGGRKIDAWTAQHPCAVVPFDQPGDDPKAFFNANTLAELQALERAS